MTKEAAQKALDKYVATDPEQWRRSLHTPIEIADMLELSERDLKDRAPRFLDDPGGEYKQLYEACVVAANALVDSYGYVPTGDGGHERVLHAAEGIMRSLGNEEVEIALKSVRTVVRPLRHQAAYEGVEAVKGKDVLFAREISHLLCPALWRAARERAGLAP